MARTITPMIKTGDGLLRAAIFLSGEGSNAERLLRDRAVGPSGWTPAALVTDRPETSRARALSAEFGVPLIELDILNFYRCHGESGMALTTPRRRELRQQWTDELRRLLRPCRIDFGLLAGFVPLCNITADFPCLNVHPGDLTVCRDGRRYLVGLHHLPVELALLEGFSSLRSSVIVAQPFTGQGEEMDSGPLLGISAPVPVVPGKYDLAALRAIRARRPDRKPSGGYGDALEILAREHLERLKQDGDWVVFPAAVRAFAAGKFGLDGDGTLHYRHDSDWLAVTTVEFGPDGAVPVPLLRA